MRTGLHAVWLAAALLVCSSLGAAAGLPVAKKTLTVKTRAIDVSVEYPQTGNKAIDATLLAYVHRAVADFKGYGTDRQADQDAYTLQTTYAVERNDGTLFAVVFSSDLDIGGAHPSHTIEAFNFLLPDGSRVFLPEIVDGARGIARISQLATAELIRTIASGPEPASDKDTVTGGAGPLADNFKVFVWLPTKLHLYFPEYQVASYAAGPQEAFLPLGALKDVIRADWRAPAPSFACARARTPVEKAICADAALARLDRQVAETYAVGLKNSYEPGAADKLKQSQRDWLVRRDKACGEAAVCLTKFYQDRLAVLNKPPA
ncbi:MAG TPA: lysozyme inhibitor LprI family protein [Rhizomicrobium sp.]|nr:lysozyme inhibitor LprI family protein [Rhizomicrobium sp.]